MEQREMPTVTVTVASEVDIKKDVKENILKTQKENDANTESAIKSVDKDFLERKVKRESSPNNDILIPSKKPRKDIDENSSSTQNNDQSTEDNTNNIQGNIESTQDTTESTSDFREDIEKEINDTHMDIEEIYSLLVSNFPENWSFPQICNYVSQSLEGVSVEMEPVLGNVKNELRLTFNSADHRTTALKALQDNKVDGNQLLVVVEGPVPYESDGASTEEISTGLQDIWEADPKGLYGLKPEYLSNLKITPPIGNWVHVTNFRCDKSEMRDAFELAGNVVACSIVNTKEKYAKIMYSHPLEAVQAVSMLNDQVFYGMKLNVTMDKSMNTQILLPKGLLSIGPGLGEDGNAVREITREYERFLSGKSTRINLSLFTAGNINGIIISHKNNHATFDTPKEKTTTQTSTTTAIPVISKPNPTPVPRPPIRPPMRPNFGNRPAVPHDPNCRFPNPPMFRGPMQRGPMMGPMGDMCPPGPFHRGFPPGPNRMPMPFGPRPPPGPMRPVGPMHTPGPIRPMTPIPAPIPGTSPNWRSPQPIPSMPLMSKCLDATTLKISNLPPTTSFPSLCGKLSTLAQVTSLEFTTPGCAVVKFASPSDAEKCFQNYRTIELS